MSAITEAEFEAALRQAADAPQYGVLSNADAERFIRAFFAALPADVKLTRADVTGDMIEAAERRDDEEPPYSWGNIRHAGFDEIFKAMHHAAPPSLPDDTQRQP